MSSPCLSSVLTHANLTMYHSGGSEVPQFGVPCVSYSAAPSYRQSSPQWWTEDQVLEWISDQVEDTRMDAASLTLSRCSFNGAAICQMRREQMIGEFGLQLGPQLHLNLQEHKAKHELQSLSGQELSETCQLLDNFLDNLSFPLLSTIKIGQADSDAYKKDLSYRDECDLHCFNTEPTSSLGDSGDLSDSQSDSEFSSSSNSGMFGFMSSPETLNPESDPELCCPPMSNVHIKSERGESPLKRPRGRPPKALRDHSSLFHSVKKTKHAPRGTHLWEFIRDILICPEKNQGLMKWEDQREGVFKFLKSEAVAQMWGQKKKNSSMTYEKLSRAMRYYYKRDILERVDGRRLVYKFGKNASGWRIGEVGMDI